MTVTPYQPDLFQSCKEIYQFLDYCQQRSIRDNQPKIANFSCEIDSLDPLIVLQEISKPDQLNFYYENPHKKEAIAAIGSVACLQPDGNQRFQAAQQFVKHYLQHIVTAKSPVLPLTGAYFFCSFTFFDSAPPACTDDFSSMLFLPHLQIARKNQRTTVTANLLVQAESNLWNLSERVWEQLQAIRRLCYRKSTGAIVDVHPKSCSFRVQQDSISLDRFQTSVSSALQGIGRHNLEKVVLAHAMDITSRSPFCLVQSLKNLRRSHPDCYIFSTSNGRGKSFIGASPERLLSVRQGELVVDALAGSAPRGKTLVEDAALANQLLSSQKEQWEHRLVVDFIRQQLIRLGIQPTCAPMPTLLQLSNIQHLHTPLRGRMPAHFHPLEVLAELHPTPAVAGMPRDLACAEIRRYEAFERSLYAAPLGWIDHQGNSEFIVGIRSALLNGYHARLYAGAGIVAGSNPAQEAAEIQLKLQALLQALV